MKIPQPLFDTGFEKYLSDCILALFMPPGFEPAFERAVPAGSPAPEPAWRRSR